MRLFLIALLALLTGCDQLGIESAAASALKREAEGKAIGGGCRHAARSVEQCYELNKRADKPAVFAGWREMNDYMRENKMEAMPAREADAATEVAAADTGGGADSGEPAVAKAGDGAAEGGAKAAPAETGKARSKR